MDSATALNLVLFLPLLVAIGISFIPREQHALIKITAFLAALMECLFAFSLLGEFQVSDNASFQLKTTLPWIPQFDIQYKVGMDGIALVLVLMTTVLSAVAILSTFQAVEDRVREFYVCLLALETGMIGVFVALDLILFYVFWEAMLIPMYILIGVWGGKNRLYATIKFVLYTLVGSLLMLVGIVWIYVSLKAPGGIQPGAGSPFDLEFLTSPTGPLRTGSGLPEAARLWVFLSFALAFAIKVPMWPFHTWLPDAHVEAPTAGSVILAGVLLKMGTFGLLRFCIPLFPDVAIQTAPWIMGLSVVGIIYGAVMAYVQTDVKRLVAYSSVSHLGFCVLGLFAFTREAVAGSVLQMVNHGISTGALFLLVGMIYERRHTREIAQFGGLWKVLPVFGAYFLITMLSSVGLPGLNGFVGEFLILLGTWGTPETGPVAQWAAVLGATGVILGAVYLLWMFQRVMLGPLENPENQHLKDLNFRELCTLAPLVLFMFWIGIAPNSVIRLFDQAVYRTVVAPIEESRLQAAARRAVAEQSANPTPGGPAGTPGTAPPLVRPSAVSPADSKPGNAPAPSGAAGK